jgi:2-(1,2-epoxy-1,2-dihydrophenyl)acetyl-CoA isomerase
MAGMILVAAHLYRVEITPDRPDRLGIFDDETRLSPRAVPTAAQDDGGRAVLPTTAGRAFCAGQDMVCYDPPRMYGPPPDPGAMRGTYDALLVRLIRSLQVTVVPATNGVGPAAEAGWTLACLVAPADEGAEFAVPYAMVGLIPETGGSRHLPGLLGKARAKGLALIAQPLPVRPAEEWGLIWEAIPDEALMDEARAMAACFAEGPRPGCAMTRPAIQAAATNSLDDHLDLEAG